MNDMTMEQRIEVKDATIRLRKMIADKNGVWMPSNLPTDVEMILDENERLMRVNGEIVKKWADAEDRALPPDRPAR
jgi:hypothetical protein